MNNFDKTLPEITKKDIDKLLYPLIGEHGKGISITLKSEEVIIFNIPVVVSCSNAKYIIDDGFMVEVVPVDNVEDFEVFK